MRVELHGGAARSAKSNRSGSTEAKPGPQNEARGEDSLDGHDVSSIDTDQRSNQKHIPKSMPSLMRGGGGSKAKKSTSKGRKKAPPLKMLGTIT